MKIKKIHRVATFRQRNWMKLFITMTTELRKQAKDDFMKTLAKLIINSGILFSSSETFLFYCNFFSNLHLAVFE